MALDKGNKSAKSKLSRPNPKQKHQQYCIEVGLSGVKVLKVDAKGKVIGSGFVPLQGDPLWSDKAWINRLSQSIKDAAKEAKVPKGTTLPCSVVAGGPFVIMQRFTWPELNHQAMMENARHEIASYLPGTQSNFVIGAEVQGRHEAEGDKVNTMDVFVAAMPKDIATAISTAVTWAGFKIVNFDVNENVRVRLIGRYCKIDGVAPRSYGLLDLHSGAPSISLYLEGNFYSTHYFTGVESGVGPQPGQTIDEIESMMGSADAFMGSSPGANAAGVKINIDAVLNEINFVVDFIKYQERGSNLECILCMGKTQQEFVQTLATGLDIPVHSIESWMAPGVLDGAKGDAGAYLDAFASGIPSSVISPQHMMDLKTAIIVKNPGLKIARLAGASLFVMFTLLAIGLLIPFIMEQSAQRAYNALDVRENEIRQLEAITPTDAQIARLQADVNFYGVRLQGIYDFYAEFAQAAVVVPIIFESEFSRWAEYDSGTGVGFSSISSLSQNNEMVSLVVTSRYFDHVSELLQDLRAHPLFEFAGTSSVGESDTRDWETGTASWSVAITKHRGMGASFDD